MFGTKIERHSYFLKTRKECFRKPHKIQNWTTNLLIPAVPLNDHSKIMLEYSTFDLIQQELQHLSSKVNISDTERYFLFSIYEIALSLIKLELSFDCNELKRTVKKDRILFPEKITLPRHELSFDYRISKTWFSYFGD